MNDSLQHNSRIVTAALILALSASGCALTFDSTSLGVPTSMASAASQPAVGDTFQVRTNALYLFWGIVPAHTPNLENVLEGQLGAGRAVRDLRIRVSRRFWDVVLTVVTAGFASQTTVTFEGIITGPAQ